ncbi:MULTISPECIES: tripartite tricarboxylate transporter permease [unclassified Halomonas]|uniref:tripartite tricarboxylate transporter permease n=1 Tax=unclassified Halomonas TaxID=2609666 RepID=UPI002885DD35|nr:MULTISPECIES: tripartite tricarboxylate transporter permease [unclassified Halomonas]MDT0499539.1 tripartite tricarboxylate transporter permease [Halomonas sp. PAR7]MDT0510644.1 tripartite tricarboxylate transporter permease [Halomonas sp. LES1]MDT0592343.1 tripartite tricarboxylate transporter permease [Halomonas sp. PAR8]
MIDFVAVEQGLALLFSSFSPWMVVLPGIVIGLIFGATPGLQISMAMAIFLPMTLYMDFVQAMLFLTAIFTGGSFGSGIPAILMNIPGTSSAIATAFDGYPMARQGKHNQALGIALVSSVLGTLMGYLILFVMIQPLSLMVLKLGPAEMFAVILWGMTLIASLKGEQVLKGLMAGFVGLLIGTIGFNELGMARGTMGQTYLLDGVPVIPAMMGMFAASELFKLANKDFIVESKASRKVKVSEIFEGFKMAVRYPWVMIRGGLIGVFVGAVPGVGSSVSNLLSYVETQRRDEDPDSFGKGNPKGVVASESANSTSEAGSMATLLALGIPGGGATAVMLAAFAMHNITGGPQFIRQQTDVVYAIIFANFAQVFLLLVIGLLFIPLLANIIKVPMRYLIPSVLVLAVMGSFGLTGNMTGPVTVLVFAVVGWIFRHYGYSVPAAVIGMLLGAMAEKSLLHSYQISGGDLSYVLERPVTLLILALLLVSLFGKRLLGLLKGGKKAASA